SRINAIYINRALFVFLLLRVGRTFTVSNNCPGFQVKNLTIISITSKVFIAIELAVSEFESHTQPEYHAKFFGSSFEESFLFSTRNYSIVPFAFFTLGEHFRNYFFHHGKVIDNSLDV